MLSSHRLFITVVWCLLKVVTSRTTVMHGWSRERVSSTTLHRLWWLKLSQSEQLSSTPSMRAIPESVLNQIVTPLLLLSPWNNTRRISTESLGTSSIYLSPLNVSPLFSFPESWIRRLMPLRNHLYTLPPPTSLFGWVIIYNIQCSKKKIYCILPKNSYIF